MHLGSEDVIRSCFYRPWSEIIREYNLPSMEDFSNKVQEGLAESFVEAVPFAGVEDFLKSCQAQSVKMGIVTSTTRKMVEIFFESHDLAKYFSVLITADDIQNFKPHPEPVFLALSRLGSKPEESLFIGDSSVDMLAANAAGLEKWLFFPHEHHVYYDFEHLKSHEPHFVFHDYSELKNKIALLP